MVYCMLVFLEGWVFFSPHLASLSHSSPTGPQTDGPQRALGSLRQAAPPTRCQQGTNATSAWLSSQSSTHHERRTRRMFITQGKRAEREILPLMAFPLPAGSASHCRKWEETSLNLIKTKTQCGFWTWDLCAVRYKCDKDLLPFLPKVNIYLQWK